MGRQRRALPAAGGPDTAVSARSGTVAQYCNVMIERASGRMQMWSYATLAQAWKPERAHHDSALGRCVLRMDHILVQSVPIISSRLCPRNPACHCLMQQCRHGKSKMKVHLTMLLCHGSVWIANSVGLFNYKVSKCRDDVQLIRSVLKNVNCCMTQGWYYPNLTASVTYGFKQAFLLFLLYTFLACGVASAMLLRDVVRFFSALNVAGAARGRRQVGCLAWRVHASQPH